MIDKDSTTEMKDDNSLSCVPSKVIGESSRMDRAMMQRRSNNYLDRRILSIMSTQGCCSSSSNAANQSNGMYIIDNLSDNDGGTSSTIASSMSLNVATTASNFDGVEVFLTRAFSSTTNSLSSTSSEMSTNILSATKRKYNSFDLGCSSPSFTSMNATSSRHLPTFTSNVPDAVNTAPTPRLLTTEFATPINQAKKNSRPNSPLGCARLVPSRSRIASIRRESDCSMENEVAYEKLVKTAQQVSMGFEEFCLDEKLFDDKKRARSLTEPISIFTNAFLPQSSSPSPTRNVDTQKQCYSPSTQQVVRNNIPYSPSPSPTPSSPTRNRIMRSMSPIAVRQISKRRYTGSGNGSGLESDGENSNSLPVKRQCTTPRSAASPLVRDCLIGFNGAQNCGTTNESDICSRASSPFCTISSAALTSTTTNITISGSTAGVGKPPRLVLDSFNQQFCNSPNSVDLDENNGMYEDRLNYQTFCSVSFNDNNSSTTHSSRAYTPMEEQNNETDMSSLLRLPSIHHKSSTQNEFSKIKVLGDNG